jgi:AraC-like DNA-binding protein
LTAIVGKPRGVLRPPPAPGDFSHGRYAAPEILSWFLEHYWTVRWDLGDHPPQIRETLPHPNVHMVIEQGRSAISGPHSGRFTRVIEGRGSVFGIKFKAGGFYPFVNKPIALIADRTISLSEVFGSAAIRFESELLAIEDDAGRMAIANEFLSARAPAPDPLTAQAAAIVASIVDDRSVTKVEQLVDRHAVSKRALQRLFQQYVGVGPKWVINRFRLHEALEQLANGVPTDWATIALDLGYFDQAHFIRDFKQLIGRTPAEYARVQDSR